MHTTVHRIVKSEQTLFCIRKEVNVSDSVGYSVELSRVLGWDSSKLQYQLMLSPGQISPPLVPAFPPKYGVNNAAKFTPFN
jgi:hypothetical protein